MPTGAACAPPPPTPPSLPAFEPHPGRAAGPPAHSCLQCLGARGCGPRAISRLPPPPARVWQAALWGHSQPSPRLGRADHQPATPAGSALRAPRPCPHCRRHLLHWGPRSHRPAPTPCPQTLGSQQMPLLRGSCSLGVPTPRQHLHAPWYPPDATGLGVCLPREPDQPPRFLQPPVIPEGTV